MRGSWALAVIVAMGIAYRLAVFGVIAYAVFWQGHSGWWFLLAVLIGTPVSVGSEGKR